MTTLSELSEDEKNLLEWLSQEDTSQYGECYGKSLDTLIAKGYAFVHGEESGMLNNFIAKKAGPDNLMFRAVSLTPAGMELAKEMRNASDRKSSHAPQAE
jgi:hypothetical protein